jgi:hypothetical protein
MAIIVFNTHIVSYKAFAVLDSPPRALDKFVTGIDTCIQNCDLHTSFRRVAFGFASVSYLVKTHMDGILEA